MKIPLLLAVLSFLLFAFTAKSSSASSTDHDTDIDTDTDTDTNAVVARSNDPVLDVNNKPLTTGTGYHIVAANDAKFKGHGFEQSGKLRNKHCPHYNVVLDNLQGSPLTFTQADGNNVVKVSTYLNIQFSRPSDCNTQLVWKVDDKDKFTSQWFITTDGVKGDFGDKTIRNWFQFVKVDNNIYNMIYCPDLIRKNAIPMCQNVSYYAHDKAEFLALSRDRPLDIMFRKAA